MSPGRVRDGDVDLVRRAARRLGVQAAALVALTVLLMAGFGAALVLAAQNNAAEDLLRQAAVTADDPGDPPAGTWLALQDAGGLRVTASLPRGLPVTPALTAVSRTGRTRVQVVRVGRADYLVRTMRRGGPPSRRSSTSRRSSGNGPRWPASWRSSALPAWPCRPWPARCWRGGRSAPCRRP